MPNDYNFDSTDQGTNGVNCFWVNGATGIDRARYDDGQFAEADFSGPGHSDDLFFYDWRGIVPAGAVISNITFKFYARTSDDHSNSYAILWIAPNTRVTGGIFTDTDTEFNNELIQYTVGGDLSFWNLTNQEALDAINAVAPEDGIAFQFSVSNFSSAGDDDQKLHWIEMEVLYTSGAGAGMLLGPF